MQDVSDDESEDEFEDTASAAGDADADANAEGEDSLIRTRPSRVRKHRKSCHKVDPQRLAELDLDLCDSCTAVVARVLERVIPLRVEDVNNLCACRGWTLTVGPKTTPPHPLTCTYCGAAYSGPTHHSYLTVHTPCLLATAAPPPSVTSPLSHREHVYNVPVRGGDKERALFLPKPGFIKRCFYAIVQNEWLPRAGTDRSMDRWNMDGTWKDTPGWMEEWKDGRMEEWKDGIMEEWKDGRME